MRHRQVMLEVARLHGATHLAMIDADEILTANLLPMIRSFAEIPTGNVLTLPGYNLRCSLTRYHASGIWGKRWFSVVFADSPELHWGGDKFHSREPVGRELIQCQPFAQDQGGVLHLWGASERRLIARHALYKVTERIRWPDKPVAEIDAMYSWAIHGRPGVPRDTPDSWRFGEIPAAWWAGYEKWTAHLNLDAEPWQEAAVRQAIELHGPEPFRGLDLFGLA